LGLDRGGSCLGLAFRVPADLEGEVLDYLRARELVTHVYLERRRPVRFEDGGIAEAVCYVVDRAHDQYAGSLDVEAAARQVTGSVGQSGPNEDYVLNTVEHLRALGIRDHWLEAVAGKVRRMDSAARDPHP
jgi:cation transport protein ChaC